MRGAVCEAVVLYREHAATQQMRLDRLAHRVKNDDKITGETLSQTVPGNTPGKGFEDIGISPKTKGYRHSS